MRKVLYSISIILVVLLNFQEAYSQTENFDKIMQDQIRRGNNLRFVSDKGLRVSVVFEGLDDLGANLPFSKESLVTDIELKLDLHGINYTREYDLVARPVLYITVLAIVGEYNTIFYSGALTLETTIIEGADYRDKNGPIFQFNSLTLYDKHIIGEAGKSKYSSIRNNLLSLVDSFIADYNYANRK
ncbi:hypothetical protein [Algoriphagus sp.]|uniref:hypothetical protein n=1 Tax=Algoriphagus sp. TaxID=1872435 RepID=UPI003918F8F7